MNLQKLMIHICLCSAVCALSCSLREGTPLSHARTAKSESASEVILRGEAIRVRKLARVLPKCQLAQSRLDDFQNGGSWDEVEACSQASGLFAEVIWSEVTKCTVQNALSYLRSLPAFLFHLEIVWDPPGGDRLLFGSLLTSNPNL